jgi:hypothetical protein
MSFVSLLSAIGSKLNTLTGSGKLLQVVYQQHTTDFSGFPAATYEPSGNTSDFYTNTDNLRAYAFDIYIHQEIANAGRANAVNILAAAVDAVIAAFDADYNLGGACDFVLACPSDVQTYVGANGEAMYAKITLVCKKEVTVTP